MCFPQVHLPYRALITLEALEHVRYCWFFPLVPTRLSHIQSHHLLGLVAILVLHQFEIKIRDSRAEY
jgi:hypothetical protein